MIDIVYFVGLKHTDEHQSERMELSLKLSLFANQSLLLFSLCIIASLHWFFIWNQHILAPDDNVWNKPYRERERLAQHVMILAEIREAAQRGSTCCKLPEMGWCWVYSAVGAPPCLFLFSAWFQHRSGSNQL